MKSAKNKSTKKNDDAVDITVGIYYELPDGKIAFTYGFDGRKKVVSYYFDDAKGGRSVDYETLNKTWRPRRDLSDFPNARDPRLPYYFDLMWDIKYTSEMRAALADGHEDSQAIRAKLAEHNIKL